MPSGAIEHYQSTPFGFDFICTDIIVVKEIRWSISIVNIIQRYPMGHVMVSVYLIVLWVCNMTRQVHTEPDPVQRIIVHLCFFGNSPQYWFDTIVHIRPRYTLPHSKVCKGIPTLSTLIGRIGHVVPGKLCGFTKVIKPICLNLW